MAAVFSKSDVQESIENKSQTFVKIRNTLLAVGLGAMSVTASAVSLGNANGSVVLGAPVDLNFQLQPDPGSDVASSCVFAKITVGDTAISDQKVRVTPFGATGVRVRASIAVDEPVLRVTLSAGCMGAVTRIYTFLVDLPTAIKQAPPAMPLDLARLAAAADPAAAASSALPAPANAQAIQSGATALTPPVSVQPGKNAAVRGQPTGKSPVVRTGPRAPAPAAVTPRLLMEPLGHWLDLPVVLRSTDQLTALPTQDASPQRAQAQALWRSLNAQPGTTEQDSERLKTLETDAVTLQAQLAKDRADAAQLRQQLALAEQERFAPTTVYTLGGLLALAILLAAWAWSRLRKVSQQAERSWHDSVVFVSAQDTLPSGLVADSTAATLAGLSDVELSLSPMAQHPLQKPLSSSPEKVAQASAQAPAKAVTAPQPVAAPRVEPQFVRSGFAVSQMPLHIVNPEDLLDIQQQAEFYTSVGEHERAIDVLKEHIADHQESSPLAYLELLRLYHTLSRVDDFAQLQAQFMLFFNAQVSDFSGFHRPGRPLWHYTEALAEIEAWWTTPDVVQVLEAFMFHSEDAPLQPPFDLAAYDDLLLLLAIARTTPASARGASPPRQRTTPAAQYAVDDEVMRDLPHTPIRQVEEPNDMIDLGLDFDMAAPPEQWDSLTLATGFGDATSGRLDFDVPLDIDLSELPSLRGTGSSEIPASAPPDAQSPIGFGARSELFEVRFEEELFRKRDK